MNKELHIFHLLTEGASRGRLRDQLRIHPGTGGLPTGGGTEAEEP